MQADDSDDGDERVGQSVTVDYRRFREPLGAGGADIVAVELFEHGGADHAGEDGGERNSHGDGGQNEVAPAIRPEGGGQYARAWTCAGDGKPAEADGEDEDQDWAEREGWDAEAEKAGEADGVVLPAAAASGRKDSGGNGEDQAEDECGEGELDGVGVAGRDEVEDRVVEADAAAEVAVENALPVVEVLDCEGLVEAVLVAEGGEIGGGCSLAEHLLDGVAGNEMDEQEDERNDYPDDGEG